MDAYQLCFVDMAVLAKQSRNEIFEAFSAIALNLPANFCFDTQAKDHRSYPATLSCLIRFWLKELE